MAVDSHLLYSRDGQTGARSRRDRKAAAAAAVAEVIMLRDKTSVSAADSDP